MSEANLPPIPPTSRTDADPFMPYPSERDESRWHVVFGVLGLLYGGVGVLAYGGVSLFMLLAPLLSKWIGRDISPAPETYWLKLVTSLVLSGLAVLLVVGAIGLLRKKRVGHRLVTAWAASRLVVCLLQLLVGFMTIDLTVRTDLAAYERQMGQLNETERARSEEMMKRWGIEPPSYESMRASAPRWIATLALAPAVCPLVVGLVLTSRRTRASVAEWPG